MVEEKELRNVRITIHTNSPFILVYDLVIQLNLSTRQGYNIQLSSSKTCFMALSVSFASFAASSAPQLNIQMPDASSLKDMLVISGKEWDRINQQLYRRQLEQEKIKAIREEKEARKALSKEMVKDWPNTLEVSVI